MYESLDNSLFLDILIRFFACSLIKPFFDLLFPFNIQETLALFQNPFSSGTLPTSYYRLSSLNYLDLRFCRLTGVLDDNLIFNWQALQSLYLEENSLSGNIPLSLTDLPNLGTSATRFECLFYV